MSEYLQPLSADERRAKVAQISKAAFNSKSFWIFCHENPDGDCLGCCLAVYGGLVGAGFKAQLFTPDPIPRMYQFLPHVEHFDNSDDLPEGLPDVVLVCDNASFERLGKYAPQLTGKGLGPVAGSKANGSMMINIDHHIGNELYGDLNLVDTGCGACGELFYYIFRQLRIPITKDVAINLYAAILTDTGRFSYGNTNQETFRIASELIRIGVDPFDVVNRVYNTRTPDQLRLLAKIMDTLTTVEREGYFYCFVTQQMLKDTNTVLSDTEGAMDLMKTVGDFEVCFLFKEEQDGNIKASVRSNGHFDVNKLAQRFSGGGHPAASGFRVIGSMENALDQVAEAMEEMRGTAKSEKEPVA